MKSKFDQMLEHQNFRKFIEEIMGTANYHVAMTLGNADLTWSIKLLMAYAFEAGMKENKNEISNTLEK